MLQVVLKHSHNADQIGDEVRGKITEFALRGFRALGVAETEDITHKREFLLPSSPAPSLLSMREQADGIPSRGCCAVCCISREAERKGEGCHAQAVLNKYVLVHSSALVYHLDSGCRKLKSKSRPPSLWHASTANGLLWELRVLLLLLLKVRCCLKLKYALLAAAASEAKWEFVVLLPLFDPPRHDTKDTIEKCIAKGIQVKMVTGDQLLIGKETAKQLGMGTNMYTTEVLLAVSLPPHASASCVLLGARRKRQCRPYCAANQLQAP